MLVLVSIIVFGNLDSIAWRIMFLEFIKGIQLSFRLFHIDWNDCRFAFDEEFKFQVSLSHPIEKHVTKIDELDIAT